MSGMLFLARRYPDEGNHFCQMRLTSSMRSPSPWKMAQVASGILISSSPAGVGLLLDTAM